MHTISFDTIDALDEFILDLMDNPRAARFNGIEVQCDQYLGLRKWTMRGPKTICFTVNISPDDLNYTAKKLIEAGILNPTHN